MNSRKTFRILILGASYGSLLGTKMQLAGHPVTLVCTADTALLINEAGTEVRLPVRGSDLPVAVFSRDCATELRAATPEAVNPAEFDLVVLAMQEPQYGSAGVRELLDRIAHAQVPCMAIMNMPPPPYLRRLAGVDVDALAPWYAHPDAWNAFDPELVTLASPDPQAFRPPEEPKNVLHVGLPTNFKVARLGADAPTDMLRQLQSDIEAIRYTGPTGEAGELPVKLKVADSLFVPLAKWSMLVTGNYRCVQEDAVRPIREAVHDDLDASRRIYAWVNSLVERLGGSADDSVPFDKYAKAAEGLLKPSSAARALAGGATAIERVDGAVQALAKQHGMQLDELDATVASVDAWLARNRAQAGDT